MLLSPSNRRASGRHATVRPVNRCTRSITCCFWRTLLLLCLLLLLDLVPMRSACASVSGTIVAPDPGSQATRKSGLQLMFSSDWVETVGHRPLTLNILAVPAVPRDRTLTIEITPTAYGNQREVTRFTVTIPEGSVRASKVIPLQQTMIWNTFRIQTYEDGNLW